jgi:hypothetical protein
MDEFRRWSVFKPQRIADGPSYQDSGISRVNRIENLDSHFAKASLAEQAPLVVSPSSSKILYLNPLRDFWYGWNSGGSLNQCLAIIGYSLPKHDEYVRQALATMILNFQRYDPHLPGFTKTNLKVVDKQSSRSAVKRYKSAYSFVDWRRADRHLEGFDKAAIEMIFRGPRGLAPVPPSPPMPSRGADRKGPRGAS